MLWIGSKRKNLTCHTGQPCVYTGIDTTTKKIKMNYNAMVLTCASFLGWPWPVVAGLVLWWPWLKKPALVSWWLTVWAFGAGAPTRWTRGSSRTSSRTRSSGTWGWSSGRWASRCTTRWRTFRRRATCRCSESRRRRPTTRRRPPPPPSCSREESPSVREREMPRTHEQKSNVHTALPLPLLCKQTSVCSVADTPTLSLL